MRPKYGIISFQVTGKNGQKLNLTVDIQQGKLFVVRPNKTTLDSSNVFLHDKSKIFVLKIDTAFIIIIILMLNVPLDSHISKLF